MAHFAELDANSVVLRVIVVDNEMIRDADGVEQESIGVEYCRSLLGGTWVQTSYNGKMRKHFAGVGYAYDPNDDVFIPPAPPGDGWCLDRETYQWRNPELEALYRSIRIKVTRV